MLLLSEKRLCNLFRVALISSTISALCSASASSLINQTEASVLNVSQTANDASPQSFDATFQKQVANQSNRMGMQNHYDDALGKATFLWANESFVKPDMSKMESELKTEFAANYYMSAMSGVSTQKGSINNAKMANLHDTGDGVLIAKYRQEIAGIEVFNREMNIAMDRDFNLVATSGYFSRFQVNEVEFNPSLGFGTVESAIQKAVSD